MTAASAGSAVIGDPKRFLASARWALRVARQANASLLAAVAAVIVVRGLIPAGMALTARGLVNATVATLAGSGDIASVVPWLLLGFVLTVAEGIGQLAGDLFSRALRDDLNYSITLDVLRKASVLPVALYDDPRFQDVLQRAKEQPAEHVSTFLNDTLNVASNMIQIVSLLGVLVYIEPLVLVVAVVFALPYLRFQWRLALHQYVLEHSRTTKRRWSGYFVSLLTGRPSIAEVRMLGLAPFLVQRFQALMAEFRDQDRVLYRRSFAGSSLFIVLTTLAIYAIFVRVALRVIDKTLTLGDLAVFGGATTRLRNTMQSAVRAITGAMQDTLYIANVIDFLALEPRAADAGGSRIPGTRGEVELRDVSFTYQGATEKALDGISLRIAPGETVALVGENGAGKTTLVKLIAGLYPPDEGEILFDGVELRALSAEDLRQRIAFVFQSFARYETSAGENIAYGDWRRLIADPERVQQVAAAAGVDEMIRSLPRGYETQIGRTFGEHDLSGGQWQSMAVARAFARDAALLILDEPTSNLDARAEYNLFRRFQELAKGRTTIIVSHRFSSVRVADRIIVMEKGRIVESGSHDELIARAGGYARLYELHIQRLGLG